MSWCRWAEPCGDSSCLNCPGSDLYIYEGNRFVCCGCLLQPENTGSFECETESEMLAHILEHDKAGHHIVEYLLDEAKERK